MKKISLITLLHLPLMTMAQWEKIPQGLANPSLMSLGGAQNIFLAASDDNNPVQRIAYSYSQGVPGTSWGTFTTEYESEFFLGMDFVNDSVGFICGGGWFSPHRNILMRTIDAGQSWETVTRDSLGTYQFVFNKVDFITADSGFVSSDYGPSSELFRTTNGGQSWESLSIDTGYTRITDLHFVTTRIGYITTQSMSLPTSSIYRTTDFGNTWQVVYTQTDGYSLMNIHFVNEMTGYVCGAHGSFLKTTDGGASWISQYLWPYNDLDAIWFVNEQEGYLNLNGIIQKTTDGGNSWHTQIMTTPNIVNTIQFTPDGSTGYLLAGGYLYKTTNGGGPTSINTTDLKSKLHLYPNPASTSIHLQYDKDMDIQHLWLRDISGKVVKIFEPDAQVLPIAGLASGVYFLTIQAQNDLLHKKIIIQ